MTRDQFFLQLIILAMCYGFFAASYGLFPASQCASLCSPLGAENNPPDSQDAGAASRGTPRTLDPLRRKCESRATKHSSAGPSIPQKGDVRIGSGGQR